MPSESETFLTQSEAARLLRLLKRTLERLRRTGDGPAFLAFGRRRLYARADLLAWADAQRRSPTSARRPAEDAMKPIDYGRMNKGIV